MMRRLKSCFAVFAIPASKRPAMNGTVLRLNLEKAVGHIDLNWSIKAKSKVSPGIMLDLARESMEKLAAAEIVWALQGKRITSLEERKTEPQEIKVPDYYSHLEECAGLE
jgi:hypothetical protein